MKNGLKLITLIASGMILSMGSAAFAEENDFPVEITHVYGTTVIENAPERVVAIGDTNADAVISLGVVPAALSQTGYGAVDEYGIPHWVTEAIENLGGEPNTFNDTDGIDFEMVNDAEPDMIFLPNSGITEEEYERLSAIAPTIPYKDVAYAASWDEEVEIAARALGMTEKGEAVIADTRQMISDTLAEYPQLEGKTAAFCWIDPSDLSTVYIFLPLDPRAGFLEELGLELPDDIEAMAEEGEFSIDLSLENIDVLNSIDIIVCYGEEGMVDELQKNEVMSTVPAVANGAIVPISSESELYIGTYVTVLSIPAVLDEYVGLLAEAADKVQ